MTRKEEELPETVDKIQWHPGFYGAAELEFKENKNDLEFHREYNLSKEPIRIDLLVVKKKKDVQLANEIGSIFKTYNIFEYKSPEDSLNIDDYFKTIAYACLYKSLGKSVNAIPVSELTVSLFRQGYPQELIQELKRMGLSVEEKFSGIYYVIGNVLFPTQIVVTKQLRKETHSSLRVLAKNAEGDDVRRFIEESNKLMEQGDRHNIDAVLEVSTAANEALYEEVRRMFMMGPALRRLMKEDIDSAIADGRAQGMAQGMADGMAQGSYTTELSNIRNLMDSMKWTVEQAMDALKVPEEKREKYLEELK